MKLIDKIILIFNKIIIKFLRIFAPLYERLERIFRQNNARIRPAIEFMKLNLKGELIGLEIGVYMGDNAKNMLLNLPIKKLYLIDSYELIKVKREDIKPSHFTLPSNLIIRDPKFSGILLDFRKCYDIAKRNLRSFENKIIFIRKKSIDASNDIPDNSLDFIYIDADHNYLPVLNDIKLYFPKLKKGGVISGDDFSAEYHGVAKAVIEFASESKLKIYGRGMDWWMIKK